MAIAAADPSPATTERRFGIGSLAVAGFIAGPVAPAFMVAHSIAFARASGQAVKLVAFLAVAIVVWLWSLISVPRDALSELFIHAPQALALWLGLWLLLRTEQRDFLEAGGTLRSTWTAVAVGVLVSLALRVALRVLHL